MQAFHACFREPIDELVSSRLGTHRDAVDLAVVTGGCDELLVVDDGDLRTPVVVG